MDGTKIYLYGEGWNFGEVANNARGVQRHPAQHGRHGHRHLQRPPARRRARRRPVQRPAGAGLRHRPVLRPERHEPGHADGAARPAAAATGLDPRRAGRQPRRLHASTTATATWCAAREVDYNGQPAGYTRDPQEIINYVEAHDNETLFDAIQLKAPARRHDGRPRAHAEPGHEPRAAGPGRPVLPRRRRLLRSKSLDRNSYNSGRLVQQARLHLPVQQLGRGPAAGARTTRATGRSWRRCSRTPRSTRRRSDIRRRAATHFREMLRIRKSSPLFRLRTADQVDARLPFANGGPNQIPGLIVMRLSDRVAPDLDPNAEEIIVFFNANDQSETLKLADTRGRHFKLTQECSGRLTTRSSPSRGSRPGTGRSSSPGARPRSSSTSSSPRIDSERADPPTPPARNLAVELGGDRKLERFVVGLGVGRLHHGRCSAPRSSSPQFDRRPRTSRCGRVPFSRNHALFCAIPVTPDRAPAAIADARKVPADEAIVSRFGYAQRW